MNIEENIRQYHPNGFLNQLGERIGCIVGLGDYNEKRGTLSLRIRFIVRTRDCVWGNLDICFCDGKFNFMEYRGFHPFSTRDDKQLMLYFGEPTKWLNAGIQGNIREDGWEDILFPGIVD